MVFDLRPTEDVLLWSGNANMAFDSRPTKDKLSWPGNANMLFELRPTEDVLSWPGNANTAFDLVPDLKCLLHHFLYSSFHLTPSTSEYDVFGNEDTPFVTPGHVPLTPFIGPHETPSDASLAPSNDTPMHRNGRVVSRDHQPYTPTQPSPYVTSDCTSHQPPHHESGGAAPDLSHVQPTDPLVLDSGSLPLLSTHSMATRSQTGSLRTINRLTHIASTVVPPLPRSTAQAMFDPNWKQAMDS
nr:hypothetical protein [Tanacetum cinerariifolium]